MNDDTTLVERLTNALVRCPSVVGTQGEVTVMGVVDAALRELTAVRDGHVRIYRIPCERDGVGRFTLVAHLPGHSPTAVLLFGHTDTVGIRDYGSLEALAFEPDRLTAEIAQGVLGNDLARRARTGLWQFGRGILDMKAGVAASMAAFDALTTAPPNCHIFWAVTPDEEVGSVGVQALIPWLQTVLSAERLRLVGTINADFVTIRDGVIPWYLGSLGKLLGGVYVQGEPSHVGEPTEGIDPNWILAHITRAIVYNRDLGEESPDESTPLPVSLRQRDHKDVYDVQTAPSASAFYNLFSMNKAPHKVLSSLRMVVEEAVRGLTNESLGLGDNSIPVWTFAELWSQVDSSEQAGIIEASIAVSDLRDRSLALITRAARHVKRGPLVVVFFATGLIPSVSSEPHLNSLLTQVIADLPQQSDPICLRQFYPYISDLSFLAPAPSWWNDSVFTANFPPTRARLVPTIKSKPVTDWVSMIGAAGRGGHRADEGIYCPYTYRVLPVALEMVTRAMATREVPTLP